MEADIKSVISKATSVVPTHMAIPQASVETSGVGHADVDGF